MVRVRRRSRPKPVVVASDFTEADVERMRELVSEGLKGRWEPHSSWEQELEVLHHIRGRLRGDLVRFMWQLDRHWYTLDEAVDEEIRLSVPANGRGIDRRFGVKYCERCEGLVHGRFHVRGDRYWIACDS